jgi:hypothetical protein
MYVARQQSTIELMKWYSSVRAIIRMSVCIGASLAAPACFGAAAERQQAQAQLLDHVELPCTNCFFGTGDYYYCFAVDSKILLAYQRTRVLNWTDGSKNYLTKVHHGWNLWTAPGQTVPISYDNKHIWVTRADGKQVRLNESYSRDIFTNDRCRKAVKAKAQ